MEGVDLFAAAADKLYASLAEKREKVLDGLLLRMSASFGEAGEAVQREVDAWNKAGNARRLWRRTRPMTNKDEDKWLGWLDIVERENAQLEQLRGICQGRAKP